MPTFDNYNTSEKMLRQALCATIFFNLAIVVILYYNLNRGMVENELRKAIDMFEIRGESQVQIQTKKHLSQNQGDLDFKENSVQLNKSIETQAKIENIEVRNNSDELKISKLQSIFEERRKSTENFCEDLKANGIKWPSPMDGWFAFPSNLLVLKERNLVWCPVFKSATSTWMTFLVKLSSLSDSEKSAKLKKLDAIGLGRSVAPRLTKTAWNQWLNKIHKEHKNEIKFTIVRHPFERLVSAFREKLERSKFGNPNYMKDIKSEIRMKYRKKYLEKFGAESLSKENNYGALVTVDTKSGLRSPSDPTFWEFVQWFVTNNHHLSNEHWIPVMNFCSVCQTGYDYIVKFEDLATENELFLKEIHLDHYLETTGTKINVNHPKDLSR